MSQASTPELTSIRNSPPSAAPPLTPLTRHPGFHAATPPRVSAASTSASGRPLARACRCASTSHSSKVAGMPSRPGRDGELRHRRVDQGREDEEVAEHEHHRRHRARELEDGVPPSGARTVGTPGQHADAGEHGPRRTQRHLHRRLVHVEPGRLLTHEIEGVRAEQGHGAEHDQDERDEELHAADASPPLARFVRHVIAGQTDVCRGGQHQAPEADGERQQPEQPRMRPGLAAEGEGVRGRPHEERREPSGHRARDHQHQTGPDGAHVIHGSARVWREGRAHLPPRETGDETGRPHGGVAQRTLPRGVEQVRAALEVAGAGPRPHQRADEPRGHERRDDHQDIHAGGARLRGARRGPPALSQRPRHVRGARGHDQRVQQPRGADQPQDVGRVGDELPEHARSQPRQIERRDERQAQDGEVEDQVAQAVADRRPGVAAEQPQLRREVVAVAAKEADFARLLSAVALQRGHPPVGHGGLEPAPDIAAARHGGDVIEALVDPERIQPLQHAEPERGAADATA